MPLYVAPAPKGAPPLDLSSIANTVLRKDLDVKHKCYQENAPAWENIRLMYEGGRAIKDNAQRFLVARPKEDSTVYSHRLAQFAYENNIGAGLGWHEASMFAAEPAIDVKVDGAEKLPEDLEDFYSDRFLKNCDRAGTTFVDLFRKAFTSLLLYKTAYICTDFPARAEDANVRTRQDELTAGLLDPTVCVLSPLDVINWGCDCDGNLSWALVYSSTEQSGFLAAPQVVERWYFYDKQTYRVYECTHKPGEAPGDKDPAQLIRVGYHALWSQNAVPLDPVTVPDGWYLGNRVYLPAMEHVNISNVLKWSLFMAGLAVPVLITDDDIDNITHSEYGFIKLGIGSDYKFAEPTGVAWKYLAERAATLKEEIWRGMYLVAQARSTSATASAQSGVSKQQDMQPSHDVLNGMGDVLRAAMQRTLERVAQARQNVGFAQDANVIFDVRGFSFEDKTTVDDLTVITEFKAMDVPSDIADKEADILACRAMFKDANPERLQEMVDEIMAAPTKQERAVQAQADMAKQMAVVAADADQGMEDDLPKAA